MKIEAFILAGGKSSRMGSDKGLIQLNGSVMIQKTIDVLNGLNASIKIVANNEDYTQFGLPVFSDVVKEKGPLGGILTALEHAESDKIVVLSCDTPFISAEVVQKLSQRSVNQDVVISSFQDRVHPLIGVYAVPLKDRIRKSIEHDELKIMSFVQNEKHEIIKFSLGDAGVDEQTFTNINSKEDLEKLEL